MNSLRRIAIVIYGPPGSGKGTQADLLADMFGLVHFDTGRFMEAVFRDPKRQKEKTIQREKKLFDQGILMTPIFILREVSKGVQQIAKAGRGIVFSGSPRTMYEAEGLVPILEKLYRKSNVFFIRLDVDPKHSLERNSKRLLCSFCHSALLTKYYPSKNPKHCPVCGGSFYKRSLDNKKVIPRRLEEYKNRTEPIFGYVKKRGHHIFSVDGRPEPYKVFQHIERYISRKLT